MLKGKTAVTSDSNDEAITGTLELTGNAGTGDVLESNTFYNTDAKTKLTGTMTNHGAVSQTLNAGNSYTIPAGYHNGSGKVTANSLSSQTSGTAAASEILSGETAWVNGVKITGTMTNRGAVTSSLNAGGTYTIPAGYHNGSGKVTANSLSSHTSGTANASRILSGYTAWVNGSKITGTMTDHTAKPSKIQNRRLANGRFEVAVDVGYYKCLWADGSYEYMELSEVASTLGLTAAKLVKGQTVCGITGTTPSGSYNMVRDTKEKTVSSSLTISITRAASTPTIIFLRAFIEDADGNGGFGSVTEYMTSNITRSVYYYDPNYNTRYKMATIQTANNQIIVTKGTKPSNAAVFNLYVEQVITFPSA